MILRWFANFLFLNFPAVGTGAGWALIQYVASSRGGLWGVRISRRSAFRGRFGILSSAICKKRIFPSLTSPIGSSSAAIFGVLSCRVLSSWLRNGCLAGDLFVILLVRIFRKRLFDRATLIMQYSDGRQLALPSLKVVN